jgi:hypothetical protein
MSPSLLFNSCSLRAVSEPGAHMRFRAVMMTSIAFILGLLPLVIATGAAQISRTAVGTAVFGGMLAASSIGIFMGRCSTSYSSNCASARKSGSAALVKSRIRRPICRRRAPNSVRLVRSTRDVTHQAGDARTCRSGVTMLIGRSGPTANQSLFAAVHESAVGHV